MSEFIKLTSADTDRRFIMPKRRIEFIEDFKDYRFIAIRRFISGRFVGVSVKETLDELMEMLEFKLPDREITP